MFKIRKIKFVNHPILKNLELNFCDTNGNPVDTIIFAGENGTGKSTILNCLYTIVARKIEFEANVEWETNAGIKRATYRQDGSVFRIKDDVGFNCTTGIVGIRDVEKCYPTCGIYSDVDINFHSREISNVTSEKLDEKSDSRRSTNDLPTQINQLLVDIQALDDADVAIAVRQHPTASLSALQVKERMPRFTTAFNRMFESLTYSHIETRAGHKSIIFMKNGIPIPINALSSGEKQVVYRGCFLLKDANAMNGAFVFIDEPEISLHPTWQMKVMDYYKSIFTNEHGSQTSQMFVVTHSPFIIHNESRRNDKVIVLTRDVNGDIIVKDKPDYFKCDSVEAIKDAFSIQGFSADKPTIYLEGRTDEKYFNKALEVYGLRPSFQFKWVGHMGENNQEEHTGKDALNKAAQFLIGRNLPVKNVCLFDCDTHRAETEKNNVYTRVIPSFESTKRMKKGIENALVLDAIDTSPYYERKIKEGDYGDDNTITDFKKMEFCEHICSLDTKTLEKVFVNLRKIIESMERLLEDTP
ncbi:MAG: ATP-binding protein [Oscillibacter sp.]|nr:ATP-binding protein [Oscillibacter sp.]